MGGSKKKSINIAPQLHPTFEHSERKKLKYFGPKDKQQNIIPKPIKQASIIME